jgi:hypothetical protein
MRGAKFLTIERGLKYGCSLRNRQAVALAISRLLAADRFRTVFYVATRQNRELSEAYIFADSNTADFTESCSCASDSNHRLRPRLFRTDQCCMCSAARRERRVSAFDQVTRRRNPGMPP